MNRKHSLISSQPPPGMRDYLPIEAELIEKAVKVLLNEFSRWGYRRVITPNLDYLDVFLLSSKGNELFKVADIGSGEMMSFRSDFTPQIGRLSSSLLNSLALPYKFSYFGPVLRNSDPVLGKQREILQAGVELIGPDNPESDAELIIIGIEALKKLGINDFSVDIGNVEFFRGIVSDINETERKIIEEYTLRKDSSGLNSFLKNMDIPDDKKNIIKDLPFMFGEKSVIKRAWKMAGSEAALNALDNIERVLSCIKSYKLDEYVTIDLGEIRGLNYYTGTIFECFTPNTGYEIFGGGRYNNLIGAFGRKCPGAGLAVNIDVITRHLSGNVQKAKRFLLFNKTKNKKIEAEILKLLRKHGFGAETNFMDYDYASALRYMEENDIDKIIFINYADGSDKDYMITVSGSLGSTEKSFTNFSEFKKTFLRLNGL